jgi:GNAT superfamily N-acetyltransferase
VIRPPRSEDAPAIADLLGQLGYPASPADVLARVAALGRHPDVVFFVAASEADSPIGLATGYVIPVVHNDDPVAVLSALVVDEKHRRSGVGRRLVEAVHTWARQRDAYRVTVSTGLARAGAHGFYERLGYEHTSRRYSRPL